LSWTIANLAPGASPDLTFSATVLLPTGGVDEYLNVAEVTASDQYDPDSTPGNDDGDQSEDDEASAGLLPGGIGLAKAVQNVVNNGDGSFTVAYLLIVENFGRSSVQNLEIFDDFATQFAAISPSGFTAADGTLAADPGWDGTAGSNILAAGQALGAGATGTVEIAVTVVPGADFGPHENSATFEGTTPSGTPLTDTSTSGTDPDPDGNGVPDEDTPTPVSFDEDPSIGVAKAVTGGPASNGDGSFDLVYTLVVENLGDVDLAGLQVSDDLATTFGAAFSWSVVDVASAEFSVNAGFDGDADSALLAGTDTLGVGTTGSIDVTVRVTPGAVLGPYENTATASGTSRAGTTVADVSQDGVDPDPDGNGDPADNDDPTSVTFPGLGGVSGTVWADRDADGTLDPGESRYGGVTVELVDPGPDGVLGTGDDAVVATAITAADGTYTFVDVAASDYAVVVDLTTLPPGVAPTYDIDGGDDSLAAVTVPPGAVVEDVDFGYTDAFDVSIVKTVAGEDPEPDAEVDFILTVTNEGPGVAVGPFTVSDEVPAIFDILGVDAPVGWSCGVAGQDVTCTLAGDLVAGDIEIIVVRTVVVGEAGDQATNAASVSVDGPIADADGSNNDDEVVITISDLPLTGTDLDRIAVFGMLLLLVGAMLAAAGARRTRRRETSAG
jgi:hypothetical protein